MMCRLDLQSDPISLKIIAHQGTDAEFFDSIGHDGFVEICSLKPAPEGYGKSSNSLQQDQPKTEPFEIGEVQCALGGGQAVENHSSRKPSLAELDEDYS